MSGLYFQEFNPLLSFLIIFFFYWSFFFKLNFYGVRQKQVNSSIAINKTNLIKKLHFSLFLKFSLVMLTTFFIFLILQKGFIHNLWWNHILLNNFNYYLLVYFLLFNLLTISFIYFLSFNSINYSTDYFFAILNLSLFLPLIFTTNNVFTFFFLLEVNSCLIFYKFVSSKIWYKNNFNALNFDSVKFNKLVPSQYLNVLFFQYWATFFSSIFILFFFINIIYIFGSTEWGYLNFIIYQELELKYFNNNIFMLLSCFIFLIGVFLKIGLTPFHLFKIEVYKGIPFLSIFFYTTYYFLVFFFFFTILLLNYLASFYNFIWFFLFSILIIGSIYIISLLFDVNYIKAFFAYSTVINSLSFFFILVSVLNIS
jgi:hypothetical protein